MTVTISIDDTVAIVVIDNPPVNALSTQLRQDLLNAVSRVDSDDAIRAVVLICAGRTFIAGADVNEFGRPPEPPHLPELVAAIERSRKPWIAAIHGSALGGGLEIALGCAYRVALPGTNFGLPEVKLGVIPGAGGTVRLPRLIGLDAAVDLITSGRVIDTEKARAIDLVDAVISGDLLPGATAFARVVANRPLPKPLSARPISQASEAYWERAKTSLAAIAKREIAPLKALASIRNATLSDFADAMNFERNTFLGLRSSTQAAALRHLFFAERAATRPPDMPGLAAEGIRSAAVIGGGTMGVGIAAALCQAGVSVVLIERDQAAIERGMSNLRAIFEASVKRGRITREVAAIHMSRLSASTNYACLKDVDLVVEAVFEDLDVKRAVFETLSAVCRPEAILATNTSYLDPNDIGAGLVRPDRFLGLHFFSPAHIMKLLEIVPTSQTSQETFAAGLALARMLGKIPVRAGVCDGFIGNRLLKVTRSQAERLLLSGATPTEVDAAMRSFGMPMGPFEAQDLAGLDIAEAQRKAARIRGDAAFAPIADKLCGLGRFGQKSGAGWYDYIDGDRKPRHSKVVANVVAVEAGTKPAVAWDEKSMIDAVIFPMMSEGATMLAERIALRSSDIDIVGVHGYGFPRWTGGLMHYAESIGLQNVVERLWELSAKGLAPIPSDSLVNAAAANSLEST